MAKNEGTASPGTGHERSRSNLSKAFRRIGTVVAAVQGRLDYVQYIVAYNATAKDTIKFLKKCVADTSGQANYWYKLWIGMGIQFANTQNFMANEIDRLRRMHGEWDGKPFLDGKVQKAFQNDWSNPTKHPANPKVAGIVEDVRVPPQDGRELIRAAEDRQPKL